MQDVFAMPSSVFVRDLGEYISELALNFSSRCQYDAGHYSEPLMYLECYKDWLASDKKLAFSRRKGRLLSQARSPRSASCARRLQTADGRPGMLMEVVRRLQIRISSSRRKSLR